MKKVSIFDFLWQYEKWEFCQNHEGKKHTASLLVSLNDYPNGSPQRHYCVTVSKCA